MTALLVATAAVAFVFGLAAAALYHRSVQRQQTEAWESQKREWLESAQSAAANHRDRIVLDAQTGLMETRRAAEAEIGNQRQSMTAFSEKLDRREESLQTAQRTIRSAQSAMDAARQQLATRMQQMAAQRQAIEVSQQRAESELVRIAGMDAEQAKCELIASMQQELEQARGKLYLREQQWITSTAPQRSRDILLTAIQRFASSHTADVTTSAVDIPTDDIKGRIIGREGRNIRTFEKLPASI